MKEKIKNLLFDSNQGKIKLNQKASIFFFCLLLSTFFWFLSVLSKNYTTTLSIPLVYGMDSKDFLVTEEPINAVSIQVSGSGFELLGEQWSLSRRAVEVDLKLAKKVSGNKYGFSAAVLREEVLNTLDKDLNLNTILTDSIVFRTQRKIRKRVAIKPLLDLSFKAGYRQRGKLNFSPTEVEVSGPESIVDSLLVVESRMTNLKELSDTTRLSVELLNAYKEKGVQFSEQEVEVFIPVEKFTEKVFELDVQVDQSKSQTLIRTFPSKVKVAFSVPLSKYEVLTKEVLIAQVDFSQASIEDKKLNVTILGIPEFCELTRLNPERVEFIVKK